MENEIVDGDDVKTPDVDALKAELEASKAEAEKYKTESENKGKALKGVRTQLKNVKTSEADNEAPEEEELDESDEDLTDSVLKGELAYEINKDPFVRDNLAQFETVMREHGITSVSEAKEKVQAIKYNELMNQTEGEQPNQPQQPVQVIQPTHKPQQREVEKTGDVVKDTLSEMGPEQTAKVNKYFGEDFTGVQS